MSTSESDLRSAMRTVRAAGELRSLLDAVRHTKPSPTSAQAPAPTSAQAPAPTSAQAPAHRIGLVPTMGALHEGHLSLIARAREECLTVVVTLFVNPTQFDEQADLDRYPRRESADAELARRAGADVLFAPAPQDVYPEGFATQVEVLGLTDRLEGQVRGAAHFRGVTTVVAKLLNMVQPDVAYFGQKDAQQVAVVKRMVSDLDMPVEIEVCPTVREPDGLAMSSRNVHLSPVDRARAGALFAGLQAAQTLAAEGECSARALQARARETMRASDVEPEYLALVDPDTFEPVERLGGRALMALAAKIGRTRLIDNLVLEPNPLASASTRPQVDADTEHHANQNPLRAGEPIATCSA